VLFCVLAASLAASYKVKKYPTLRVFRFGQPTKHEYRGERTLKGIRSFVEDQLRDVVNVIYDLTAINNLDVS